MKKDPRQEVTLYIVWVLKYCVAVNTKFSKCQSPPLDEHGNNEVKKFIYIVCFFNSSFSVETSLTCSLFSGKSRSLVSRF